MSQNQYPSTPPRIPKEQPESYFTSTLDSLSDIDPYSSMRSYKPQQLATPRLGSDKPLSTPIRKQFDLMHSSVTPFQDNLAVNAYQYPTPSKTSHTHAKPVFSDQSMERRFKPQTEMFGSQLPSMQSTAADAAELLKSQETIRQLREELEEKDRVIRDLSTQNEANVTALVLGKYTDQADGQELAHRMLTRLRTLSEENAFLNNSATAKRVIELEAKVESLLVENSVLKKASRYK